VRAHGIGARDSSSSALNASMIACRPSSVGSGVISTSMAA
jgi:hypothetical protein